MSAMKERHHAYGKEAGPDFVCGPVQRTVDRSGPRRQPLDRAVRGQRVGIPTALSTDGGDRPRTRSGTLQVRARSAVLIQRRCRMNAEQLRLVEEREQQVPWKRWGPYLSERQWGTVRED